MKCNKQLKNSNHVAFSRFHGTAVNNPGEVINGTFLCTYYGKEKGIGKISDSLITGTPYKAYTAICEQEAYERIVNGEFAYGGNEYLEIQVLSCSLTDAIDSKGYYQPNYRFECMVNGKESEIIIPAIKD